MVQTTKVELIIVSSGFSPDSKYLSMTFQRKSHRLRHMNVLDIENF